MEVASRPTINLPPEELAARYRMNVKPRRTPNSVVQRKAKCEQNVPTILIEVADEVQSKRFSPRNIQIQRTISGTDDGFDSDEDGSICLDTPCPPSSQNGDAHEIVVKTYLDACKKFRVTPLRSAKTNLVKTTLPCKFIPLGKKDMKAICYTLTLNRYVERLEFEQNQLCLLSAEYLSEVIISSSFLTHVTIIDNALRTGGARAICEAVQGNSMITYLDLSGNDFVEHDGVTFQTMINKSKSLRELYLGRNKLMDIGVKAIASAVEDSISLKVLDLQWNHIRLGGAIAIGEAIEENRSLEIVNLAWNGLHVDGAEAIADALKNNDILKELDLTCNRLSEKCIFMIMKGLENNSTLEVLRIGQNHVTCTGAEVVLKMVLDNAISCIQLLDMGSQEVKDSFVQMYRKAQENRAIEVLYGMVWDTRRRSLTAAADEDDDVALLRCNPLTVLMECMRLQNLRLIDFFKSLDTNKSNFLCIKELTEGMVKVGVPIRRTTLHKLLTKLDRDNNHMLDFGEMVEAQNLHRLNLRRALAEANNNFEKTEIGRASAILRRIMAKNFVMNHKADHHDQKRKHSKFPSRPNSGNVPKNDMENVETKMGGTSASRAHRRLPSTGSQKSTDSLSPTMSPAQSRDPSPARTRSPARSSDVSPAPAIRINGVRQLSNGSTNGPINSSKLSSANGLRPANGRASGTAASRTRPTGGGKPSDSRTSSGSSTSSRNRLSPNSSRASSGTSRSSSRASNSS